MGGYGLPRYGGIGGKGGDVWVAAEKGNVMSQSLKKLNADNPLQRFEGGIGQNSA